MAATGEHALRRANDQFRAPLPCHGRPAGGCGSPVLEALSLEQMEAAWQAVKEEE